MIISLVTVFLKTAYHGCRLLGQSDEARTQVKKQWAQMVIKSFGFSLQVQGTAPASGALIIVGNHISFLDIPVLMAVFPEVTFIAKDDLKKWPIIGRAATVAGTVFVNRSPSQNRQLVRDQVTDVLINKNKSVAIFPSGTTSLHEEKPWKKGAFEIAKEASVPVQLFRIDYQPLRASAYIDEDNLLSSMLTLFKIKNKSVSLKWLGKFENFEQPYTFCEELRQRVVLSEN